MASERSGLGSPHTAGSSQGIAFVEERSAERGLTAVEDRVTPLFVVDDDACRIALHHALHTAQGVQLVRGCAQSGIDGLEGFGGMERTAVVIDPAGAGPLAGLLLDRIGRIWPTARLFICTGRGT